MLRFAIGASTPPEHRIEENVTVEPPETPTRPALDDVVSASSLTPFSFSIDLSILSAPLLYARRDWSFTSLCLPPLSVHIAKTSESIYYALKASKSGRFLVCFSVPTLRLSAQKYDRKQVRTSKAGRWLICKDP